MLHQFTYYTQTISVFSIILTAFTLYAPPKKDVRKKQEDLSQIIKDVKAVDERNNFLSNKYSDIAKKLGNPYFLPKKFKECGENPLELYRKNYEKFLRLSLLREGFWNDVKRWSDVENDWRISLCKLQNRPYIFITVLRLAQVNYFVGIAPEGFALLEHDMSIPELHYVRMFFQKYGNGSIEAIKNSPQLSEKFYDLCLNIKSSVQNVENQPVFDSLLCLAKYLYIRHKKKAIADYMQQIFIDSDNYARSFCGDGLPKVFFCNGIIEPIGRLIDFELFEQQIPQIEADVMAYRKELEKAIACVKDAYDKDLKLLKYFKKSKNKPFSLKIESNPGQTTTMPMSYVEDVSVGKNSSDAVVQIQEDSVENKQLGFSSVIQGDWHAVKACYLKSTIINLWTRPEARQEQRALKYGQVASDSGINMEYQQWLHCFSYVVDRYINGLAYKKVSSDQKVVSYYILAERRNRKTGTATKCIFTFARYAGTHTWFHRCCTTLALSVQEIADKWAKKDFFVPGYISPAETMPYSSVGIPVDVSVKETSCFVVIYDPNHEEDIYLYKMEAY